MKGDYCTREGAERLKQQIEAYWAERGHDVKINLVQGGFLASMRSARTDVRSNMVNGIPTRSKTDFG
ncbi:MAG: phosphoglycolate phosphatase [Pseudomonadota bacterium]